MKIICEECGSIINTKTNKICPNCNSSYKSNKEYNKKKNLEKIEKLTNNELEKSNVYLLNVKKRARLLGGLFSIVIICFAIFTILSLRKITSKSNNIIDKVTNETQIQTINGKINSWITNTNYRLLIDDIKLINDNILIHYNITNTKNEVIKRMEPILISNNNQLKKIDSNKYKELPLEIKPYENSFGYALYITNTNNTDYEFIYDNISVNFSLNKE